MAQDPDVPEWAQFGGFAAPSWPHRQNNPVHGPFYALYQSPYPVVGSVAPDPIVSLLLGQDWQGNLGGLAEAVIERQLESYHQSRLDALARERSATDSLVEHTALKIAESLSGADPADDVKAIMSIPRALARKAFWNWERLPYTSWRSARTVIQEGKIDLDSGDLDSLSSDIDEWILRNERALRDDERSHWTRGLVKWSLHSSSVFPGSTLSPTSRVLRREFMSGFKFLDEMRPSSIQLQPSLRAFDRMFQELTGGLLEGLDWTNVFIAGGIVLSALTCVDIADVDRYRSSDIDIYMYGLDAKQANTKVEHIFQIWKSNLPPSARDKTLVVRNSRTITFFSEYPIKRVQIVMKLVKSPRHVLLNFDLDVCSMGWDGQEVWLLPRAVRALETGYNVFTMNMIEGHYLGERRATQEQRVFKYADKGYGIRILPSYLDALSDFEASIPEKAPVPNDHRPRPKDISFDLNAIADRAARWTQFTMRRYSKWGYSEEYYPRTKTNPEGWKKRKILPTGEGPHLIFNHDMLEERSQKTSEPSDRSCLSGFELLMRHVELWREKVRGNIIIQDHSFASVNYDVGPTGYDDTPLYQWNADFSLEDFKLELDRFNTKEMSAFLTNLECGGLGLGDLQLDQGKRPIAQRTSHASTVSEILSSKADTRLYLFVPPSFPQSANGLIHEALLEHGLDDDKQRHIQLALRPQNTWTGSTSIPVCWRIDSVCSWQQIDRRIDEVHEVLWSFYRSHDMLRAGDTDMTRRFYTEISRRVIRPTPTDEFMSFARWLVRSPVTIGYSCAVGQGFWGWGDDCYDEEESVFTDSDG